jgi:hypothetical protein
VKRQLKGQLECGLIGRTPDTQFHGLLSRTFATGKREYSKKIEPYHLPRKT